MTIIPEKVRKFYFSQSFSMGHGKHWKTFQNNSRSVKLQLVVTMKTCKESFSISECNNGNYSYLWKSLTVNEKKAVIE